MLHAEHIYYENKLQCFTTIVSLEKSHNWTHVKLQFYNFTVMILIMQSFISALTWYFNCCLIKTTLDLSWKSLDIFGIFRKWKTKWEDRKYLPVPGWSFRCTICTWSLWQIRIFCKQMQHKNVTIRMKINANYILDSFSHMVYSCTVL